MPISRKLGKFTLPQAAIHEAPDLVKKVTGSVIILSAGYSLDANSFEYLACGDAFAEVPEGEAAPFYDMDVNEAGEVVWTKLEG